MIFNWDGSKYATISDLQAEMGHVLIDALQLKPQERILDIGCGVGNLTVELASRSSQGFVLGIDASASMIGQAKRQAQDISNIDFRVLDMADLRFQQEFDVVFSNSVLHWASQPDRVLAAIRAALKPGGRIGLQFPLLNDRHPLIAYAQQVIAALSFECYYRAWKFPWFVTTAPEYIAMLQGAGFQNVTVKTMQTSFRFEAASKVYDFFEAVGLDLYLSPLESGHKLQFKQRLCQELERADVGDGILLHFERLFALGSVPE